MATNPYFSHMYQANEQDLSHDLVEEIIQLSGIDVYYIKIESVNSPDFDRLFGENRFEKLKDCYLIEMYPKNFDNPMEGNDLFTKFGISDNQTITFEVSYRRFEQVVKNRPREGDYIYIPAYAQRNMDDIFRIMYVETYDETSWMPQGTALKYYIKCERATFSHQELETGIENFDFDEAYAIDEGLNDPNRDNELIQGMSDFFIDFDENHPFGKP